MTKNKFHPDYSDVVAKKKRFFEAASTLFRLDHSYIFFGSNELCRQLLEFSIEGGVSVVGVCDTYDSGKTIAVDGDVIIPVLSPLILSAIPPDEKRVTVVILSRSRAPEVIRHVRGFNRTVKCVRVPVLVYRAYTDYVNAREEFFRWHPFLAAKEVKGALEKPYRDRCRLLAKRVAEEVNDLDSPRLLELGSGYGLTVTHLAKIFRKKRGKNAFIEAQDFNLSRIAYYRAHLARNDVKYEYGDLRYWSAKREGYDVVFAHETLCLFDPDDACELVLRIYRAASRTVFLFDNAAPRFYYAHDYRKLLRGEVELANIQRELIEVAGLRYYLWKLTK